MFRTRVVAVSVLLLLVAASTGLVILPINSFSVGKPRSSRQCPNTQQHLSAENGNNSPDIADRRQTLINAIAGGLLLSSGVASAQFYMAQAYTPDGFRRIRPIQFMAALDDPNANSGTSAKRWGLWIEDPGPRGVWLRDYETVLVQNREQQYRAPSGWTFDPNDWWLEEHGLIMERPTFPVPPGRYLVTGGRSVTTGLTIDVNGNWKLDGETTLYDVTHLPCRSARYHPTAQGGGSPSTAKSSDFPVLPGAAMPQVAGCDKQDYAVLFVVGKAV